MELDDVSGGLFSIAIPARYTWGSWIEAESKAHGVLREGGEQLPSDATTRKELEAYCGSTIEGRKGERALCLEDGMAQDEQNERDAKRVALPNGLRLSCGAKPNGRA